MFGVMIVWSGRRARYCYLQTTILPCESIFSGPLIESMFL